MKIILSEIAHKKIMYWVHKADFEVSGFGKVTYNEETEEFFVHDAYLVKQEGGGAHTDIDPTALAQLMYKTKDQQGFLNYWWHSHVNMQVFWSSQDRATIEELGEQGFCVATVFNKKNERRSAVCAKMEGIIGEQVTFWDEITTQVHRTAHPDTHLWDAEFTENVTEKKWQPLGIHYDSNRSILTSGINERKEDDVIPWWAQQDAELLGMTPKEYWDKTNTADYSVLCKLDADLDRAAERKYGKSYSQWQQTNWKA